MALAVIRSGINPQNVFVVVGGLDALEEVGFDMKSQVQRVTADDAKVLLENGAAVLYDVRTSTAYESRHIVGAVSFPEAQVSNGLATLPVDKALIFYCI